MKNNPIRSRTAGLFLVTAATALPVTAQDWSQAPLTATGPDFIAVFETLSGKQPGTRKGHARGLCAAGEFTPSETAQSHFSAPLFASGSQPVTMRFSMGGGNPVADERSDTPRGVGIRFPADPMHHIAGITSPVFVGKNPQQFLGLLRVNAAIKAGEATADDRVAYFKANPEVLQQVQWMASHPPSTDYTNATYYGVHTFFADGRDASDIKFRWQLEPRDEHIMLTPEQRENADKHFLDENLLARVAEAAPAVFDWYWVIGNPEDSETDPSEMWPADRERIHVGSISVTGAGGDTCDTVNFDPTQVTTGVRPSDDPALKVRSVAYAISFGKRLSGN